MNCTVRTIANHTKFDFGDLLPVYLYLNQTCSSASEIFYADSRLLTDATCKWITREDNNIWTAWTAYPLPDIWTRIVTWKLPLAQLVAQFPRPPLGFWIETATIVHLLGDPIDSMTSMLVTLASHRSRVRRAQKLCDDVDLGPTHPEYQRAWMALALIMISYDECGVPEKGDNFCADYQALFGHIGDNEALQDFYEETAYALAADRSTRSLPVVFAESIFIGGWLLSLLRAGSSEPSPSNWVPVEAHSVAFSGLYLWVTSAVIIGSVIGCSQTEGAVPRILQNFEYHAANFRGHKSRMPSAAERESSRWCRSALDRAMHGGIYSWIPTKWNGLPTGTDVGTGTLILYSLFSIVAVGVGYIAAMLLSYFVTPRGPGCRHIPESCILILWLLSFGSECVLEILMAKTKRFYSLIFAKDLFFALSNIAIVMVTQWGIMNRCSCWTTRGLHLPQLPEIEDELMGYIKHGAPWIVFMAILLQLILCAVVIARYHQAVRVCCQRDDGMSNLAWRRREYLRRSDASAQLELLTLNLDDVPSLDSEREHTC